MRSCRKKCQNTDLIDGIQHKLVESTDVVLAFGLRPLLGFLVEKVVAPQSLHELVDGDLELFRVHLGKLLQRERPPVQSRPEANRALVRENLKFDKTLTSITRPPRLGQRDNFGHLIRLIREIPVTEIQSVKCFYPLILVLFQFLLFLEMLFENHAERNEPSLVRIQLTLSKTDCEQ